MVHDPVVAELRVQISIKKARYAQLRKRARQANGANPCEFQELLLLLQEINYLELSFRREPGVTDFLKEPDSSIRTIQA